MKVIDKLETMKSDIALTNVCTYLISQLCTWDCCRRPMQTPINSQRTRGHPSTIWGVWQTHNIQPEAESHLCLQLIVDRLLKQLISNRVKAQRTTTTPKSYALNKREKNAVCCMAGYVAVSLLKRFKKWKNKHVQLKRDLFVPVLRSMRAEQQPSSLSSIEEYTQVWSDLIDRGSCTTLMTRFVGTCNFC